MSTTKKKTSKKLSYGHVEIAPEAFMDRNVKVRISTFVDLDVLEALKAQARERGTKYQTLLNETLRSQFLSDSTLFDQKVESIVEKVLARKNVG